VRAVFCSGIAKPSSSENKPPSVGLRADTLVETHYFCLRRHKGVAENQVIRPSRALNRSDSTSSCPRLKDHAANILFAPNSVLLGNIRQAPTARLFKCQRCRNPDAATARHKVENSCRGIFDEGRKALADESARAIAVLRTRLIHWLNGNPANQAFFHKVMPQESLFYSLRMNQRA